MLKCDKVKLNSVEVFWAPFLRLHLGIAETFAANFINEDELWMRYFVGILIQSAIACYAYWKLQTGSVAFNFTANLILIAGTIKCFERIWILRSSSFTQLRISVLSSSPPQGSTFMADDKSSNKNMPKPKKLAEYLAEKYIIEESRHLQGAYLSFKMFLPLFGDLKLGIYRRLSYIFTLDQMSTKQAFKLIGTELGFLYDVLYSKTTLCNSIAGLILRSVFLLFSSIAFIVFSLIISRHFYSCTDIIITYLLLFGAIFTDLYALIAHTCSIWTVRRLTECHNSKLPKCFNKVVAYWLKYRMSTMEIKCMAQHNLLEYCLKTKVHKFAAAVKIINIANLMEKLQFDKRVKVDNELKDFIFCHLKQKREQYEKENFQQTSQFVLLENGAYELLKSKKVDAELGWSIKELEFTHSLLLWHIATDILYFDHSRRHRSHLNPHHRISKLLSDYMMHLLVKCPFMLRTGIGELRYRDTFWEARTFLKEEMRIESTESAATTLVCLDVQCRVFLPQISGELGNPSGKSVFFGGCRLARELQSSIYKTDRSNGDMVMDYEELWEMIKTVWVEMMISAAYTSHWKEHAKQLRHGGELLTHVALLMAHLGLSRHIWMTDLPPELDQMEGYNPPWDWEKLDRLAYYLA